MDALRQNNQVNLLHKKDLRNGISYSDSISCRITALLLHSCKYHVKDNIEKSAKLFFEKIQKLGPEKKEKVKNVAAQKLKNDKDKITKLSKLIEILKVKCKDLWMPSSPSALNLSHGLFQ